MCDCTSCAFVPCSAEARSLVLKGGRSGCSGTVEMVVASGGVCAKGYAACDDLRGGS
jgi:hypothetical protein